MKKVKIKMFGETDEQIKIDEKKIPVTNIVTNIPSKTYKIKIDHKACQNSYNCVIYCPHDAIRLNDKGKPVISPELCTGCLICLRECPCNAISEDNEKK